MGTKAPIIKEGDTVREENGVQVIEVGDVPAPASTQHVVVDVSERNIERMARGFIMGTESLGRRKEIRERLEERVTKRIGGKGKYLVDKLFELIDGVYIIDKAGGKEIRYYKVPPNLTAIIYALDRVLGKPKQHIEKKEEKKGIYVVETIIRNLATPGAAPMSKATTIPVKNEHEQQVGTGKDN